MLIARENEKIQCFITLLKIILMFHTKENTSGIFSLFSVTATLVSFQPKIYMEQINRDARTPTADEEKMRGEGN